jgi:hypothetical protein
MKNTAVDNDAGIFMIAVSSFSLFTAPGQAIFQANRLQKARRNDTITGNRSWDVTGMCGPL